MFPALVRPPHAAHGTKNSEWWRPDAALGLTKCSVTYIAVVLTPGAKERRREVRMHFKSREAEPAISPMSDLPTPPMAQTTPNGGVLMPPWV